MPQVVAAAKTAWAAYSAWAAQHVVAAAIIKAVATVAVTYGIGRALAPKLAGGNLAGSSPLQMGRDPVASRRIIYGQTRVGGPMLYAQVTGSNNEYLHIVEGLVGHACQEIGDIYFADEVVPLDGSGNATGPFAGFARVIKHLGGDGQTADANLVAESGGLWTTNHRLRRVTNIVTRLKWDATKFPGGIPNISAVVKGRLVFDPRSGLTEWSANVALCVLDYLTNADFGLGVDYATEIDEPSFIAAANVCDEDVALAAGGTEKRYTCNGSFELSAEPATVLEKLCAAMAGVVIYIGGKWICQAGAHQTPSATALTEDDLRGPITVQTKLSLRDTCNRVKGTFVSPDEKWQPADITPITNATYLSEDGGVEIWRDLQLDFVTSHAQGQRLLKIELEQTRQDITVRAPCKLTALRYRAGSVVPVTNARFGWTDKLFIVTGLKFAVHNGGGAPALGVDLELRETAAAVWDWASGEETTYDPAPNTSLKDARTVAAPTSLVLTSSGQGLLQPDGTYVPRLKAAWTAPADQAVQSGGLIRLQYKTTAAPDWSEWGTVKGDQVFLFILDVLIGTAYDVRIRAENNFGAESAWATPAAGSHTVVGDTTAPSALADPVATAFPGYNRVTWVKSAAADISEYRVYRDTDSNPSGATYLGETGDLEWNDVLATPGVAYYYFVLPVDASENPPLGTITNISAASNAVTTLNPPVGAAVPANPTAAAKPSTPVDGTYLAGDGTVFSFITMEVPAMPANAIWQNLLYRRTGSGDWLVAAQLKNTGTATLRLDDLTPGVSYDVATQAWSGAGGSAVVVATGSPFTAPNRTDKPAAPTIGAYVGGGDAGFGRPQRFANGARWFMVRCNWTPSTSKEVAYYECAVTNTDSDAAADAATKFRPDTDEEVVVAQGSPTAAYFRVRVVSASGVASDWAGGGTNLNSAPLWGLAAASMSAQDNDDVNIDGGHIDVDNAITAPGFQISSSRRFKRRIRTLRGALAKVRALRAVTFEWRDGRGADFGLIAEQVAQVFPEAVGRDERGRPKAVDYGKLSAALIGAVQELETEVRKLKRARTKPVRSRARKK